MSQEAFGDVPLFRELQKLLSGSSGPINMEIAGQVGVAVAKQGFVDPPRDRDLERAYADAVHSAELVLSGYTRMPLAEPMAVQSMGRGSWVRSTLESWRWLLEHLARRFSDQFGQLAAEDEEAAPLNAAFAQMAPLLFGIQAGSLVGQLGRESLARYDLPIPRSDDGGLFVVAPNVRQMIKDYEFDVDLFLQWLALREVARHLLMQTVSWLPRYTKNLLIALVDTIELDVGDFERRLMELQTKGIEALQEGLDTEDRIPLVDSEAHVKAQARLQALIAVIEGYASHGFDAVSAQMQLDDSRIREGMARRHASPTEGERALTGVLGIRIDRELETSGATFCAAVIKLRGLSELNRVWDAADNLPTLAEIKDPFAWMERIAEHSESS
ncbi:MAG: zinc-dependent metalloprotease [Actinomycetota bacterium]